MSLINRKLLMLLGMAALLLGGAISCSGPSDASSQTSTSSGIHVGTQAPEFAAADYEGKKYALSDFRGQKVLLVFYMGYFCGGCRQNLSELAKSAEDLKKEAVVLAISVDPPSESAKMDQLLNGAFTLISDPELKIIRQYDAEMANMGAFPMADYWYFVIDRNGQIRERVHDPLFGQSAGKMLDSLKKVE